MASFGLANPASAAASSTGPVDVSTVFSAASAGNLALLQSSMAQLNFSVTTPDENGYTILHASSSYSQLGVLKFILDNLDRNNPTCTAFINVGDNDGDTALHYAGSVDAARMLVADGRIDVRKVNGEGKTALQSKMEELEEMKQDEDVDDDDEDLEASQKLIEYLSSLP
jgi:ankyrin repeat protein